MFTILEYFPDLGIAMVAGVITGVSGALMRSFVLADETTEGATTAAAG